MEIVYGFGKCGLQVIMIKNKGRLKIKINSADQLAMI